MPKPIALVLTLVVVSTAVGIFVLVSPTGSPDVLLPAQPRVAAEPQPIPPGAVKVLASIKELDRGMLAVSEEDGHLLRVLASSSHARHALEIGAASGYSAIWLGLGLRDTGGHLTTIEYDAARAREAAANIERAGLADVVTLVSGDAFDEIPKLSGTFDFVFLDAWKKDYKRFFDLVLPRLDRGGLFLAHNVVNKSTEMPEFLSAIQHSPDLVTAIVTPSGEGISISYKR